jgi:hypothetical protein
VDLLAAWVPADGIPVATVGRVPMPRASKTILSANKAQ